MSRGSGIVQRRLIAAFKSNPAKHFTVEDLAKLVYPDETFARKHAVAIRRALRALENLHRCRAGSSGAKGWHHVFGVRKIKCCFK